MNYLKIDRNNVANGPGVRVCIWVAGCTMHCKGCFNPETWDFEAGIPFTEETMDELIKYLRMKHIEGLTILGGEPLHEQNAYEVYKIIKTVREYCPDKSIWIYTGRDYDVLKSKKWARQIFELIDMLVDGKFEEELKVEGQFRGSHNQRFITMSGK